jgi:hypothetical protein
MTTEKIKETYNAIDSEQLFTVFVIMETRKKNKRFSSFNTPEQVDNSINMLLEIFKSRGIVFKELDRNQWKVTDFKERKAYIKLYTNKPVEKGEMIFEAVGQY